MRLLHFLFLCIVFGGSWRHVRCTCVLESEFGFTLNCAFKKSGLFRVRNLGGVKAHVGLGFTVGDELGFGESLSNLEGNRRRATQNNKLQNILLAEAAKNMNNKMSAQRVQPNNQGTINTNTKVLGVREQDMRPSYAIPPFKPIPPAQERPVTSATDRVLTMTAINMTKPVAIANVPTPALIGIAVPAFQEMPASISRISTNQQKNNNTLPKIANNPTIIMSMNKQQQQQALDKFNLENKINSNTVSKQSDEHLGNYASFEYNPIRNNSAVTNISMDAIEAAIIFRQQQLMKQKNQQVTMPTTTTTTTTTTQRAIITATIPKRPITSSTSKVMNAPKEYYPVGYDKNFDDHFASKVELPETSFYCGEQKHFPGLYADEDLGCMVFHVCALTDDGLIMKSFLCPESTLFDQTILKCNWWFYTECKNSKKLYDSNIPISKSYQLMKALTFFSSYRKDQNPPPKDS